MKTNSKASPTRRSTAVALMMASLKATITASSKAPDMATTEAALKGAMKGTMRAMVTATVKATVKAMLKATTRAQSGDSVSAGAAASRPAHTILSTRGLKFPHGMWRMHRHNMVGMSHKVHDNSVMDEALEPD